MNLDEALASTGSFKNLFDLTRKSGVNLEEQIENFLKQESSLFSIVGFSLKKISDGYAELSFPFNREAARRGGMVHGGVILYALDNAGGLAVMSQNTGTDQVTLELKANFLEPLRKPPFTVVGKAVRQGRTVAVAESEVRDADGKLCAKSLGTWYLIGAK